MEAAMSKPEPTEGRFTTSVNRPLSRRLWLALLAFALPSPAAADVIELAANGSVMVRAADQPAAVDIPAEPESLGDLLLPADAITLTSGSLVPPAYAALIEQLAETHQISPVLLEALVWQESRWRHTAVSPAGAIGLAQLMPGTARDLGVNPLDPAANLAGGARYLRQQLDRFGGDIERALAAYNAGPSRVLRAGGIPRISETQSYVRSIVDRLSGLPHPQGRSR
jgi:soluble lytic murein transglycosylase-like protein